MQKPAKMEEIPNIQPPESPIADVLSPLSTSLAENSPPVYALAPAALSKMSERGDNFPIVGIGCSAGGLEALEAFFSHVPRNSGVAFIVVQHLDPSHPSVLAELLQRVTLIPVSEAAEQTTVQADAVYIIPPNRDLSLSHGILSLLEPIEPRGLRLPIDFFLRTLAGDQMDKAVAVILSGMGYDGTLGLKAIKEKAGLTLVQSPATAKADSMPCSAIKAGLADIVASPEEMPARIISYFGHAQHSQATNAEPSPHNTSALNKIINLLHERCSADFSLYKTSTLYRRIERRTAMHQLSGIAEYLRYLRENGQEVELLFRELLIGVTNFFRDPAVWEMVRSETFPHLFSFYPNGQILRAWVTACSSGEEAYSLAIVFREALQTIKPGVRFTLQIYATDLDPAAIEKARKGIYPENIAADISPEHLARYFVADKGGYRVVKEIRDMVIFATQNLISDPPLTKLDLLCCRNLLIYFQPQLQKKLLPLFHYALNRHGVLLLGTSEAVGSFSHLFAPMNGKARLFQRLDQPVSLGDLPFPARMPLASAPREIDLPAERQENLGQQTDHLIQQTYAPPAVLVNADGDILYISGRIGKYLEPPAGKVNINIHAMAREGLREALIGVIHKALRQPEPIQLKNLQIGGNGSTQTINLTVHAQETPEMLRGRVLVVFNDVPAASTGKRSRKSSASATHEALLQELAQLRESLRITHEEMQTSMEELKSANEELQATNEELQSTNEELTTSKEEMQSLNEELQTVNAELQSKVDDLTWERNDMTNLLNSTEIATVFLDNQFRVRRFTERATRIFKLIPGDVGRPLFDVVNDLDYPQLKIEAQEVLRTLVFCEKQVSTHDERWYRVRIMPYRTQDNVIDGVVITFTDITEIKKLEARLREDK